MIIIKKQSPEFYDCRCDKCHAEFLYQLDDIREKKLIYLKTIILYFR